MTDHTLYIQGKRVGTTNISVFDKDMQLVEIIDLEVAIDTRTLQQKIWSTTGSRSIRVSTSNGQVILGGTAGDAVAADRAVSVAKGMVKSGDVVNAMAVAPSQTVMLKVRFLEVTRAAERDIGVNWFGMNGARTRGFSTGSSQPNLPPQTSNAAITGGSLAGTSNGAASNTGGISVLKSTGALLSGATPFGVFLANVINDNNGIGNNLDVMIRALETKGLIRRLAEPNLVALSGDTAKFLAGGEFPVPILAGTGQGATPSITFKKFGVSLAFSPTVLNHGVINLRISPEVSEIDPAASVTIQGTVVPGLVTRNAQTTIELRDGQSFAIAGLLQSRGRRSIDQLPWIGSIPVLGALFRSSAYQNQESDLVIIVTPHLVRPATPVEHLATPFDKRLPSNDLDFFVNGQLDVPKRYSDYVTSGGGINGPYGHIVAVEQGVSGPVYKRGRAK